MGIKKFVVGAFETNTYLITKGNKAVLVDPGLDFNLIVNDILSNYEIEAILVTHGHIDHIDGIKYFDCPVYIHKDDENNLYDSDLSLYSMMKMKTPFKKGNVNIITVEDNSEFELLGYKFKVLHTPGHTRGSVCYNYGNMNYHYYINL